ncbi:hypothetical protein H0H93_014935 [Arthromyces matolae]|nr:hypothetical protein H0H93_014935 [Arthromyces matolae]
MSTEASFDGPGLNAAEIVWREHYHHLKKCGYTLRKRYHPDWTPSWVGTSQKASKCEDSIGPRHHASLDATREDGTLVALKLVDIKKPQNDIPILHHLASEPFASNPRNHCVPILEIIEPLEGSSIAFIVMPLLYRPDFPSFKTIGEALGFWKQMIEGLHFLHENLIIHGDCKFGNFMADTQHLFDSPPHPGNGLMRRDFGGRVKQLSSRTFKPVKYYLIDFGLSKVYQPEDAPFLKQPPWGGDKTVPEVYGSPDAPPCDPFAVDVYCLGNYLRQMFLDGWDGRAPARPQGFEFMRELIKDMVHEAPLKRLRMSEVALRFDTIVARQSGLTLRSPVILDGFPLDFLDSVSHWTRQLFRMACRIPAIPKP